MVQGKVTISETRKLRWALERKRSPHHVSQLISFHSKFKPCVQWKKLSKLSFGLRMEIVDRKSRTEKKDHCNSGKEKRSVIEQGKGVEGRRGKRLCSLLRSPLSLFPSDSQFSSVSPESLGERIEVHAEKKVRCETN